MIPMIDVVFLLIIFFLVSSHLAQNENETLDLPTAASADLDENVPAPRITINLRKDGQMLMAGRELTRQALPARLSAAKDQHGKSIEVRIRCSKMTPYNQVAPIMLACTKIGIWNVTFAVYRTESEVR